MSKSKNSVLSFLEKEFGRPTSGDVIKANRKRLKFSQLDIEKLTGISKSNLSKYENNTRALGVEAAKKIAAAFNLDPLTIMFPSGIGYSEEMIAINKKAKKIIGKKVKDGEIAKSIAMQYAV